MENKTPTFKEAMNAMVGLATLASLLGMTPDDLLKKAGATKAAEAPTVKEDAPTENPTTAIAQKAREDVAALLDICFANGDAVLIRDYPDAAKSRCWCELDRPHRGVPHTYVCVTPTGGSGKEGVAVVAEGDTFIRDVGRAIALRRALNMAIPPEFLKAGRPQEKAERWVRRPAKVGETIRILKDRADGAYVDKGDTFTVRLAADGRVSVDGLMPWIFRDTSYEVLDV